MSLSLGLAALLFASAGSGAAPAHDAPVPAASDCAAGEAQLPGSGLCMSAAEKLVAAASMDAMEGCAWTINETEMPGGDYLLYRAETCGGKTTTLAYAAGLETAEVTIAQGTVEGSEGLQVATVFGLEGDPAAAVLALAKAKSPKEARKCVVHAAEFYGAPADALVVDVTPAVRAKMPGDDETTVCGDYGLPAESVAYWRPIGDTLWWIDLGQDWWGFDPATLTPYVSAD